MKVIKKYVLNNGKIPFDEWFNSLDNSIKAKVLVRLERIKIGLFGDYRNLKNGLNELKFKSGERIYFYSEHNSIIILLVNAGNKKRQNQDILKAYEYLEKYKKEENNDN